MNRHPGGEAQTLHLLENIEWKKEMKALDLGAGEGDTVRILKSFGLEAHGVDLFPRGSDVEIGDFLHLQYSSDSIDLCISQCAFFVSRDQKNALSECWRVLKKGGFLLLSDLDTGNLLKMAEQTCMKCKVPLVKGKAKFMYLENGFPVEMPVCPKCGFVYVPEELALGKVLAVERALEDK